MIAGDEWQTPCPTRASPIGCDPSRPTSPCCRSTAVTSERRVPGNLTAPEASRLARDVGALGPGLEGRMEDAGFVAGEVGDGLDPARVRDGLRGPRQHLQVAHDGEAAAHEGVHVIRLDDARMAGLRGDRGLATGRGRVLEV